MASIEKTEGQGEHPALAGAIGGGQCHQRSLEENVPAGSDPSIGFHKRSPGPSRFSGAVSLSGKARSPVRWVRSHWLPDNPWCERPNEYFNHQTQETFYLPCGKADSGGCRPCGGKYRRRVRRIFASGFSDNPRDAVYLLTLTAPGVNRHCMKHRHCKWQGLSYQCEWCPCTPEAGVDLHEWNASCGKRWNRFLQDLRREFGTIEYCKAAEVQERGALHFHATMRAPGVLLDRKVAMVRALAMKHGFGHAVDVQRIGADCLDDAELMAAAQLRAQGYCAKYASKSADDRGTVPTIMHKRKTKNRPKCSDRDCKGDRVIGAPRVRVWTSSRRWGTTMKSLKASQRSWWASAEAGDPSGVAADDAPRAAGPLDINSESYTEVVSRLSTA